MADGAAFPARDLVILLASGVILASLVIASIGLPLLLRGLELPADAGAAGERDRARIVTAKAAIAEIERVQHDLAADSDEADRYTAIAARVMAQYRERIDGIGVGGEERVEADRDRQIERDLRLAAVRAERRSLFALAEQREIGLTLAEQLGRELDLSDARLTRSGA
jgi:CPA1 family monovalent cation:H+ antiporter